MILFLKAFLISYLLLVSVMPLYLMILKKLNLFDKPDNNRKIHINPTPRLGGLIISLILLVVILILDFKEIVNIKYFLIGGFLMLIIGLMDDVFGLEWSIKIIFQLLAVIGMLWNIIKCCSYEFTLMGITINPIFGYVLLTIIILGAINSFNLIDGLDGLLTTYTALILFFILIINNNESFIFKLMNYSMLGLLFGFIIYNQNPARIFLGDSGSLILGYISIFLYLNSITTYHDGSTVKLDLIKFSILFSLPMIDTVRLIFTRIINGKSPFLPDKNHIHHILIEKGFSTNQVVLFISFFTLISILIYLIYQHNPIWGVMLFIMYILTLFFINSNVMRFLRNKLVINLQNYFSYVLLNKMLNKAGLILSITLLLPIVYLILLKYNHFIFKPSIFENDTFTLLIIYLAFYLLISIKLKHRPKSEISVFIGLLSLFYLFITNDLYLRIERNLIDDSYFLLFSIFLAFFLIVIFLEAAQPFILNKNSILISSKVRKAFGGFDIILFFSFFIMLISKILMVDVIPQTYLIYFMGLLFYYIFFKLNFSKENKYAIYFHIISIIFVSLNVFYI